MKKRFFSFIFVVISVTLIFNFKVVADDNSSSDVSSNQEVTAPSDSALKPSDFELTEDEDKDYSAILTNIQHAEINAYIQIFKEIIKGSDGIYKYLSPAAISSALYTVFFPIGLLLMFISFAVSLGRKALDGSLYDEPSGGGKQGLIKGATQLITGIIFITVGQKLLVLIDAIVQIFTVKVLKLDVSSFVNYSNAVAASGGGYQKSKIPIIGFFINLFNSLIASIQTQFTLLLIELCMIIVTVVLGIRIVKLAVYQGFSPMFFGLSTGEETRIYTKNFILQYCLISMQIIVISALVTAMQTAIAGMYSAYSSGTLTGGLYATGIIIILVFIVMILKSDKLFDKVLR